MTNLHHFRGINCAVCHHSATFHLLWASPARERSPKAFQHLQEWSSSTEDFSGLFICETCRSPTLIRFVFNTRVAEHAPATITNREQALNRIEPMARSGNTPGATVMRSGIEPLNLSRFATVVASYPSVRADAPRDLPANIEKAWVEDVANVHNSANATVMMCRRALELMCKAKQAEGDNIKKKIDWLVKEGILTKDIADWAHAIRVLGNEAVHDEESFDMPVANEIREFTRVIAEILFSYPARIARLRAVAST